MVYGCLWILMDVEATVNSNFTTVFGITNYLYNGLLKQHTYHISGSPTIPMVRIQFKGSFS